MVTKDHSLSAQWEHTVLVTDSGHEVLTLGAGARRTEHGVAVSEPTVARGRSAAPRLPALDWPLLSACRRCWPKPTAMRASWRELLRAGARGAERALPRRGAGRGAGARARALHRRCAARAVARATRAPIWPPAWRWSPSAATAAASCTRAPTSTSCCWCRHRWPDAERASVERLVSFLWDIGLEVGHSVRTVAECAEESVADVSVMTTLMEARLLAG